MKVLHKILIAPLVAILFLLALGGLSYGVLQRQNAALEELSKSRFAGYQISADAAQDMSEVHSNVYRLITWIANLKEDKIKQMTDQQKVKIDQVSTTISQFSAQANATEGERKLSTAQNAGPIHEPATDVCGPPINGEPGRAS